MALEAPGRSPAGREIEASEAAQRVAAALVKRAAGLFDALDWGSMRAPAARRLLEVEAARLLHEEGGQ